MGRAADRRADKKAGVTCLDLGKIPPTAREFFGVVHRFSSSSELAGFPVGESIFSFSPLFLLSFVVVTIPSVLLPAACLVSCRVHPVCVCVCMCVPSRLVCVPST